MARTIDEVDEVGSFLLCEEERDGTALHSDKPLLLIRSGI
jgi:hypothetical protein